LPAGTWYDWWTGEKVAGNAGIPAGESGPRWLDRPVDLATMPLYVRAGAIVPLDPVRQFTAQAVTQPTALRVYPGADGEFTLYDDDGTSLDYQKNVATWTRIRWNDHGHTLTIEPDPKSKMKLAGTKSFDILLMPEGARKSVIYSGRRVRVKF